MTFRYDILDDSEKIIYALRGLYRAGGYSRYRMGKFEEYDLYSRYKGFLASDSVITFTDTNGQLMALKPDVTLSIVKNFRDDPESLHKLCYNETVYRISGNAGAYREIMQTGLECIGAVDTRCIGEVLRLAAESLSLCGGDFVLEVSQLDILAAFVDAVSDDARVRREILRYAGEKNLHGIAAVCRENGIPEEQSAPLARLLQTYGNPDEVLPALEALCAERGLESSFAALREALEAFNGTGYGQRVVVDFSLTGNENYYNGIIFKGYLKGIPERVLSGGQYDKLMRKMGKRSRAVGFAVYLDQLERVTFRETEGDA